MVTPKDALRRTSRLRWWSKFRHLRRYERPEGTPLRDALAYVLWAPDVGDFNYELRNEAEFMDATAAPSCALALRHAAPAGVRPAHRLVRSGPATGWTSTSQGGRSAC